MQAFILKPFLLYEIAPASILLAREGIASTHQVPCHWHETFFAFVAMNQLNEC
jgi:hypothetical protein